MKPNENTNKDENKTLNQDKIDQILSDNNLQNMSQQMGSSGGKGPGDKQMESAYKLSSFLIRDRLKEEDAENIELLEDISESDVIVVEGQYDHIHLVLKHSGIPFKRVNPHDISKLTFRPDQTVFVNCTSSFPTESARKLAGFVAEGGQLITTDWCLRSVLEPAFPGMVEYNDRATADEVVRIEVLDKEDPILKGFLDEEADPQWWLEGSSYPIRVINKDRVRVLIKSKEIGEKYGENPVIINFDHGKGTVYHMISHFYLQRTETRDAKQGEKASMYSMSKGASGATIKAFEEAEASIADLNYGAVQSANTSAEFVSRALLKQKKKFKK